MMAASSCTECNQTPNAKVMFLRSQCAGDNVRTQKEKNPDRQLRSLSWLRSSHPLKSA